MRRRLFIPLFLCVAFLLCGFDHPKTVTIPVTTSGGGTFSITMTGDLTGDATLTGGADGGITVTVPEPGTYHCEVSCDGTAYEVDVYATENDMAPVIYRKGRAEKSERCEFHRDVTGVTDPETPRELVNTGEGSPLAVWLLAFVSCSGLVAVSFLGRRKKR